MAKVFVYKNLVKKCYSIRCTKTNRVLFYAGEVFISDARLVVRPGGRRRVLETGHKNIHAGVQGWLVVHGGSARSHYEAYPRRGWRQITYDPRKYDSFVVKRRERPVKTAERVFLGPEGVFAWKTT